MLMTCKIWLLGLEGYDIPFFFCKYNFAPISFPLSPIFENRSPNPGRRTCKILPPAAREVAVNCVIRHVAEVTDYRYVSPGTFIFPFSVRALGQGQWYVGSSTSNSYFNFARHPKRPQGRLKEPRRVKSDEITTFYSINFLFAFIPKHKTRLIS